MCSTSVKREQSLLPLVTYVRSKLIKVKNILCPREGRCPRKRVVVRCHHPWSHSGSPAPRPLSQGAHLPSEAAVPSEFSLPWSAWLATTLPLFVLRRTLKARFIFLKDLLLILDRSKGRAEDKWEGRNSSYSLTEILFYVCVWSDIYNNMKWLLLGGRNMGFASLYCLCFLPWTMYGLLKNLLFFLAGLDWMWKHFSWAAWIEGWEGVVNHQA